MILQEKNRHVTLIHNLCTTAMLMKSSTSLFTVHSRILHPTYSLHFTPLTRLTLHHSLTSLYTTPSPNITPLTHFTLHHSLTSLYTPLTSFYTTTPSPNITILTHLTLQRSLASFHPTNSLHFTPLTHHSTTHLGNL
jgi:hypothetical protein